MKIKDYQNEEKIIKSLQSAQAGPQDQIAGSETHQQELMRYGNDIHTL